RLQTIADFQAVAAVTDGEQKQDTFVFALLADAPGAEDRIGDIFDGFAFEAADGDQRYLGAGLLLQARTIIFQLGAALRIDYACEIAHITLRLERGPIHRERRGDGQPQRATKPRQLVHGYDFILLPPAPKMALAKTNTGRGACTTAYEFR